MKRVKKKHHHTKGRSDSTPPTSPLWTAYICATATEFWGLESENITRRGREMNNERWATPGGIIRKFVALATQAEIFQFIFGKKKWIKFQHRHQISNRETDSVQANVTVTAEGIDQRYAKHIWLKFYEMILTFYPLFVGDWAGRRARCRKVARSAVCCRTSEQTCGCHRFGKPEMCLLWRKKKTNAKFVHLSGKHYYRKNGNEFFFVLFSQPPGVTVLHHYTLPSLGLVNETLAGGFFFRGRR